MQKKHYDKWEFQQVASLKDTDPNQAIEKLEKYLSEYSDDYSAFSYYASNLITVGRIDEAEKVINDVEKSVLADKRFSNNQDYKMSTLSLSLFFNRLRIYSYRKQYDELYKFFKNNPHKAKELNLLDVMLYCKSKLGKIYENNRFPNTYLFNQISNYKEEVFLDHIKKHLADYNSKLDEPNKNIFVPDFPIDDVLKEVKKYIPSKQTLYTGFYENVYIFKYNECGRVNNRLVNYLKVICFDGTTDMITVLPVDYGENLPHVDLNYMVEEKDVKEVKKISAVERFNKRFKR